MLFFLDLLYNAKSLIKPIIIVKYLINFVCCFNVKQVLLQCLASISSIEKIKVNVLLCGYEDATGFTSFIDLDINKSN